MLGNDLMFLQVFSPEPSHSRLTHTHTHTSILVRSFLTFWLEVWMSESLCMEGTSVKYIASLVNHCIQPHFTYTAPFHILI